jgi:hypothetical protein
MNKLFILVLTSILSAGAFAQSGAPTAGPTNQTIDPKSQAAAEANHNAKPHGLNATKPNPNAAGATNQVADPKSQAAAEAKHLARAHGGLDAMKSIPLEDGSTVYVFKDGKMGMEDKNGRPMKMKPGHVMKAKDGTSLAMVGNEMMRVESLLEDKKGRGSN